MESVLGGNQHIPPLAANAMHGNQGAVHENSSARGGIPRGKRSDVTGRHLLLQKMPSAGSQRELPLGDPTEFPAMPAWICGEEMVLENM